jgi:hypothetical protein
MPITEPTAVAEYCRRAVQALKDARELIHPWHQSIHENHVEHSICGDVEPFLRGLESLIHEYDPSWKPG